MYSPDRAVAGGDDSHGPCDFNRGIGAPFTLATALGQFYCNDYLINAPHVCCACSRGGQCQDRLLNRCFHRSTSRGSSNPEPGSAPVILMGGRDRSSSRLCACHLTNPRLSCFQAFDSTGTSCTWHLCVC